MKYFIIAGEQSGDLHGANLITELFKVDPQAEIFCWGGDLMASAGGKLLSHYSKMAFMGITAVIKNLGAISKNLSLCKQHINDCNPDVIVFIDYPGFNLRIAKFAKIAGYRTFYYISPKFWAWNEGRIKKVKRWVDRMYIIFPFEKEFYKKYNIPVEYHGNPLVDEMEKRIFSFPSKKDVCESLGIGNKPVIALLAGSRKHEIETILPEMIKMISYFSDYEFVLAGVHNIEDSIYYDIIGDKPLKLVKDKTYEILYVSEAALVTSGTATLETALLGIPQIVCYKTDLLTAFIGWLLIKVKFISLVNLIMGREVIRELIQYDLKKENIIDELRAVLPNGEKRDRILFDYRILKKELGSAGASGRVAADIVRELETYGKL